jgi:transcriptional regulator with XRE-family HTH domain
MKDYDKKIFSERLKKARADKNMKQSELAQAIGVSAATISSYERSEGTNNEKGHAIAFENKVLGEFLQKIVNLLKVYRNNFLDAENFKICVDNTIEKYSKRTVIVDKMVAIL